MTKEIKFLEKFYRNIQNKIPGDYVACRVGRKGKPFVAQVDLDDFLPKLFGHSYFNVENIPLTEKILEKNGWRKNEEDSTHWEHPDVVFNIKSYGSEEHPLQVSVSGQVVPLVYVHQLQQILRFCGYIEMALSINVGESDVKNIEFSVPYKEYVTPLEKTNKSVGVDMGLKDLLVTSEGETFKNNRYTRRYERKLAKA